MSFDRRSFLLNNLILSGSLPFDIISEVKVEINLRLIFLAIIDQLILFLFQSFFLFLVQQLKLFPCSELQVFLEIFILLGLLHLSHIPFDLPSLLLSLILKDSLLSLIGLVLDLSSQVNWFCVQLPDSLWML